MNKEFGDKKSFVVGLIIIFALLFLFAGIGYCYSFLPVVTLKVDNVTIRQDEEIPEFNVYAEFSGKRDVVLNRETGYKVSDLVNELNQRKGYQLSHHIDGATEGIYPLKIELESAMQDKLTKHWHNRIQYQIEDGIFEVISKYGDWDNDAFTFLDGTKASGWTNIGPDTYYFDEEGRRVEGKQEILGTTYYFDNSGKFDGEKNKVNPAKPMIAITFDDGPSKFTMQLLEQLEAYDSRATFFMVGTNVPKYPETVKKMKEIGCELGNHTTNHARLTELDIAGIQNEINVTNQAIQSVVGETATLMRPPYGAVNEVVQSAVGLPLAMWSVDTLDWELKDTEAVKKYILNMAKDGEIILLHDIHETTVQAVLQVIPELVNRGYQLVTVSEMATARGVTLENGQKYYEFRK
ncbi:MAG: polysaccharide deacetylase family protein [Tyzzerella sp.]|nr:polysaccharide deacetylase family protein [Tyzzerella sp.]